MPTETEEIERTALRTLVQSALDSGDFNSKADLSKKAGLNASALYNLMENRGGLSQTGKKAITKFLRKYAPKAHVNGNGNGHAVENGNGHATANGSGHVTSSRVNSPPKEHHTKNTVLAPELARRIITKVLTLRVTSNDEILCRRIDETLSHWGEEALEIICDSVDQAG